LLCRGAFALEKEGEKIKAGEQRQVWRCRRISARDVRGAFSTGNMAHEQINEALEVYVLCAKNTRGIAKASFPTVSTSGFIRLVFDKTALTMLSL
jgi:hypothetical protein